jgi:hypothetical protein
MGSELRRAREAVASLGQRGQTTRVPDEIRRAVLLYARLARRQGTSWKQIAEEVGVSASALSRWHAAQPPREKPKLRRVEVVPQKASPGSAVSVVTRTGFRIEGLRVAEAIQVARALE